MLKKTYCVYIELSGDDEEAMDQWLSSGRWADGSGSQGIYQHGAATWDGWSSGESWTYDEEGNELGYDQ